MTHHRSVTRNGLGLTFVTPQLDMFRGFVDEKANSNEVTWKTRKSKTGCLYNFVKATLKAVA